MTAKISEKIVNSPDLTSNDNFHEENCVQASTSEPCPLCGKEHYCWLIKDQNNQEIYKAVCHWTNPNDPPEGWEHFSKAKDGRPIFIKQGYSRKKRNSKKYPAIITLQPEPKTDIPQWQDIEIAVKEVAKGHTVRLNPGCPGGKETLYVVEKIASGKNLGLGKNVSLGVELRRWNESLGGSVLVPLSDIAEIVLFDPHTGAKEQFIEYEYSPIQKVVRKQWTDRRTVYRNQSKQIRPWFKTDDGRWVCEKGNNPWPIYREDEVKQVLRNQGILFAVAGEQAVESIRSIGLTATCNQGGEGGLPKIADNLAEIVLDIESESKPESQSESQAESQSESQSDSQSESQFLLIIWGDNDEPGRKSAENLLKSCNSKRITAVRINPLSLWPQMPEKGDAKDWILHCQQSGISQEEMYRRLELAIEAAIDDEEQESQWRWQRQAWNSPQSYKGEIGFWKKNASGNRYFEPACNFDFQVEREIEDSNGGGLVLQIKRSFENRQYRVIVNSTNYTKVDGFVDALKRELGTGIVCNLNKNQLNALIHTRLHEYRTTREGKLFRRIERYGQQEDGCWIFGDRQYKPNSEVTNENESLWVFNPSLGKDDFIPCPVLAEENPQSLKQLVDASRRFFGQQNIHQVLLMMGWTVAGLHSQEIFSQESSFPLFNAHGEPGSCKTIAAETALSLVGKNWGQSAMLARASVSALYEHGSRTGSLPFFWDDPDRNPDNEELAKSWYNWKPRKVRGNEQTPHSPMGITSNHVFGGEQAATYTRFVRVAFTRANGGDKTAFQELKAAQAEASGAFRQLISLGYPRNEISKLESELLQYLPHAHARIAQGLSIVTWYAQKLVELTDGDEDIKQWVIDNCCKSENDVDTSGDSLLDFIDKVMALEAESLVGDWNLNRQVERNGQKFYAIYAHDVWKLVDQRFRPATYNACSLKSLVTKAGGKIDYPFRFSQDRDQVLAYRRAVLTTRFNSEGDVIIPDRPETQTRKAWLIPAHLFGELEESVTAVTECNQSSVTAANLDIASISPSKNSDCNRVTVKNELKEKKEIAESDNNTQGLTSNSHENSGYSGYTVTETPDVLINQGFEGVTEKSARAVTPLEPVTNFQIGEKVRICHKLHPQKGHVLQVIGLKGNYVECQFIQGKKRGEQVLLQSSEIEKFHQNE
ncbi:hypothetical protein [Nostoc sp. UHCC 0870]|uniref:hypothetical protein n=1 Tax=Nostoc sp. UHCC 0870 TaxID=2914041 RepID=UPI001EE02AA2|nr:hypothetical protein [Nostoc sp. UHCC 0870]UKP01451.1 hypothetical protein L6494_30060 [Nostoc sp. UHCC 0870]